MASARARLALAATFITWQTATALLAVAAANGALPLALPATVAASGAAVFTAWAYLIDQHVRKDTHDGMA